MEVGSTTAERQGRSDDVATVGGVVGGSTWQVFAVSELNLAVPFIIVALLVVPYANGRCGAICEA